MRAAQTKSLLAAVAGLPASDRSDILHGLAAATLGPVNDALPLEWLPMSLHMEISDRIRDVVGPIRNVSVWRTAMGFAFRRPFLRGFVSMTTSIFGVTPMGLYRRSEKVYEIVTKNLGTLGFRSEGSEACAVSLTGFPAKDFRFICYVEGLAGCLEGALDVVEARGTVKVVDHAESGRATYRIQWTPGRHGGASSSVVGG